MEKSELLSRLNDATDKAASLMAQQELKNSGKKFASRVGKLLIRKNYSGFYDIFSADKKKIFNDISAFDVATIIAQRYSTGEFKSIEKVLVLEHTFIKHHTDMIHYLHCIKAAKKRREFDTMAILEDKFQISEIRAKSVRGSISIFKRAK